MNIETGNIWDYVKDPNVWICVTTNLGWTKDGKNVMGAGVAKEAAQRFPHLSAWYGNQCQMMASVGGGSFQLVPVEESPKLKKGTRLGMFAVKELYKEAPHLSWKWKASYQQVARSAKSLKELMDKHKPDMVYLPAPGCGNGGLQWDQVKPILLKYFKGCKNMTVMFKEE